MYTQWHRLIDSVKSLLTNWCVHDFFNRTCRDTKGTIPLFWQLETHRNLRWVGMSFPLLSQCLSLFLFFLQFTFSVSFFLSLRFSFFVSLSWFTCDQSSEVSTASLVRLLALNPRTWTSQCARVTTYRIHSSAQKQADNPSGVDFLMLNLMLVSLSSFKCISAIMAAKVIAQQPLNCHKLSLDGIGSSIGSILRVQGLAHNEAVTSFVRMLSGSYCRKNGLLGQTSVIMFLCHQKDCLSCVSRCLNCFLPVLYVSKKNVVFCFGFFCFFGGFFAEKLGCAFGLCVLLAEEVHIRFCQDVSIFERRLACEIKPSLGTSNFFFLISVIYSKTVSLLVVPKIYHPKDSFTQWRGVYVLCVKWLVFRLFYSHTCKAVMKY